MASFIVEKKNLSANIEELEITPIMTVTGHNWGDLDVKSRRRCKRRCDGTLRGTVMSYRVLERLFDVSGSIQHDKV